MTFASEPVTKAGPLAGPSNAEVGDFVALLKPRVMSLVVFTALVGMVLAPQGPHPVLAAISLLCIAVGAGAAGALNMWWDADIDVVMARTRNRPVPTGRVTPGEALGFGLILSAGSIMMLAMASNWLAAGLLAFTIFFYVVIYTIWLKRITPQNIVIGGAAGAFPPMVAWAAATGTVSIESVLLFAIIFFWTPPHFWALALLRSDDYCRAGVPMMPVVAGAAETRRQILAYAAVLAPTGVAPWFIGLGGTAYGIVATVLGAAFLWLSFRLWQLGEAPEGTAVARRLFAFSLLYLFLLFAVLLVEACLGVGS